MKPARRADPALVRQSLRLGWATAAAGLLVLAAPGPVAFAASDPATIDTRGFEALRAQDQAVLETGYRLARANAPFCPETIGRAGLTLHHIAQYQDREAARAAFGFSADYAVLALVADGPAARAGLRRDDGLIAINGEALNPGPADLAASGERADYAPLAWAIARLDDALAASSATITVRRGEETLTLTITPEPGCASRFEVRPEDDSGAFADGRLIGITSAMLDFMVDEDERAAILAHELAHNILKHRARLDAAGIQRGLLQQFGRNARLTKATEVEADRLSIWLMANAGYDPRAAVRFWTRYGKQKGLGIFSAPTHYRWKKRAALLEAEITTLETTPRGPEGYAPPLLASPLPPLD